MQRAASSAFDIDNIASRRWRKETPLKRTAHALHRARHVITAAALVMASSASLASGSVEVMHWFTSGGEAAAIGKFKEALAARGVDWKDVAVGGLENQRLLLKTRFGKGDPPAAAQINADLRAYAADSVRLLDLTDLATQGKWDEVLPPIMQRYVKMGGTKYVAVPILLHRQNLLWISAEGLKKIGATSAPKTWDEFFAMADKAKSAGMLPLAMSEDIWVNFMFNQVAYGTMQPEVFRKAFYDLDKAALTGPGMVKAFEVMRRARSYVDRGASTRKWNEATQMVIQGKAFAQVMGDWAKGEFTLAGKKPNVDYLCTPVPGSDSGHLFNSDAFMFFKRPGGAQNQLVLAQTLMDKDAQVAFSLVKGSVPVRMDADVSGFDECARQSYADFVASGKNGKLVASPHMFQPPARVAAWQDVVLAFWNDDTITPAQAAQKMLAAAR